MRFLSGAAGTAAAVLLLLLPGTAAAASIVYVGADHNVHLTSPDGSVSRQITRDATATSRYESPSQADDGTIVAVSEGPTAGDGTRFAYFLRPDGSRIETQPLPVPSGLIRIPALTGAQVSRDGGLIVYDWGQAPFGGRVNYATSIVGRVQSQDACAVFCSYAWVGPRWASNGSTLVVDAYLGEDGVGVVASPGQDPAAWFNFSEAAIASVDESAGRLVVDAVPKDTGTVIDVVNDGPPTTLVLLRYSGAPGDAPPVKACELDDYTEIPGFARLSPDGSMLAWQDREGVYVSPVPPETGGGTCTLQPRLVAAGGSRPDWGVADVPPATGSPGPPAKSGPPSAQPGTKAPVSAACAQARKAVKNAKRRVAKARTALRRAKRVAARKPTSAARRTVIRKRKTMQRAERRLKAKRRTAARRC
jgi:hypothetical protein